MIEEIFLPDISFVTIFVMPCIFLTAFLPCIATFMFFNPFSINIFLLSVGKAYTKTNKEMSFTFVYYYRKRFITLK